MLPAERKTRILARLRETQQASVQGLAELLDCPAASVRRDLRELEEEKRITRSHGRALYRPALAIVPVSTETNPLSAELQDELVAETADHLAGARNLFLAGGALMAAIASKLSGKTIATHDLTIAMAAATAGDNDITLIGRELQSQTLTLRSDNLEAELKEFRFDVAVLETEGIDNENLWVERKNHAILASVRAHSDSFVAVAKSTTIGRKGARVAAPLSQADVIIIDRGASAADRQSLAASSIELRVTGEREDLPFGFDQIGNLFVMKQTGDRFGGGGRTDDE